MASTGTLDPPAIGNLLIHCSRPRKDAAIDSNGTLGKHLRPPSKRLQETTRELRTFFGAERENRARDAKPEPSGSKETPASALSSVGV